MLVPLEELDEARLLDLVEREFGVPAAHAEFQPVGEDSWCYRVGELWVSVRRDLRGHCPRAYEAARALRRAGLDFVLAPLEGSDGRVVQAVDGLPLVVFPYRDVVPLDAGSALPGEVDQAVEMLDVVHGVNLPVDLPVESFEIPFEDDLDRALAYASGKPSSSGPYSRRLHTLLRAHRHRIRSLRAELERLGRTCAADAAPPVPTHGEPLATNFLRDDGRLMLGDWGEAMWGPPERDWFHVVRTLGARPPCRRDFLRFYEIRWVLSEVAEYAAVLMAPHAGDADDAAMFDRLLGYIPETA